MPDELEVEESEPGRLRRMYEEASAREATANARLADLERREAFRDVGLDPTQNKLHAAAIKAYDGEMTPDAVKEYVTELGIVKPPEPEIPTDIHQVPQEDRDALVRIAEASMGGGNPPPTPDRERAIRAEMEVASRRGNNAELDRLATELTHLRGFQTVVDMHPGGRQEQGAERTF